MSLHVLKDLFIQNANAGNFATTFGPWGSTHMMGVMAMKPSEIPCDAFVVAHPAGAVQYRFGLANTGAISGLRMYTDHLSSLDGKQVVGDTVVTPNGGASALNLVHVARAVSQSAEHVQPDDAETFVASAMDAASGINAASMVIPLSMQAFGGDPDRLIDHATTMTTGIMEYWRANPYGAPHYVFFAVEDNSQAYGLMTDALAEASNIVGSGVEMPDQKFGDGFRQYFQRAFTVTGRSNDRLSRCLQEQLHGYSFLSFALEMCNQLLFDDSQIFNGAIVEQLRRHLGDTRDHIRSTALNALSGLFAVRPDLRNLVGPTLAEASLKELSGISDQNWEAYNAALSSVG
ncbi:MAG: hypothetical protein HN337_08620 [Deltaproteobacteria bacterium]|jgi:hypothetical protein|nr:hypothetical protein [Deltaproteobacteria bacterium]